MADSPAFEYVCKELEARSSLERLAARGTVRLALKAAGLDPRTVTPDQFGAVLDEILPAELETRGIEVAASLAADLRAGLQDLDTRAPAKAGARASARLGGRA
jgi:hypothetical protein